MATKTIKYDKLVRDKIPQIIKDDPTVVEVGYTNDCDDIYFQMLLAYKLIEEAEEYLESGDIEELADVYEVVVELVKLHYEELSNFQALDKLDEVCQAKNEARGNFNNRTYLHYVVKEVAEDE